MKRKMKAKKVNDRRDARISLTLKSVNLELELSSIESTKKKFQSTTAMT